MALGTIGKYERLDVLGHGASGIVYLARDTLLRRQVAIKEVSAQGEERERLLEEARVLDRLRHPNIVEVHNVDTIGGKIVIDMEYVDGENLLEVLRRAEGEPLSVATAVDIAVQVCDGLAYAQERHIIHRDIKPANILVSRSGQVKLVDFGLAQVLGTNSFVGGAGTYAYMAPEDFEEGEASGPQADIWAVGVLTYEMLTGHRPFNVARPKDPFAWKRAIESQPIEAPSLERAEIPGALSDIVLTALARDIAQRYRSAADLAAALRRFRAGDSVSSPNLPSAGARVAVNPVLLGATDLDSFLSVATERWEESRRALIGGALAEWLHHIGEAPLADVARSASLQASRDESADHDALLRDFLYRAGIDTATAARRAANTGSSFLRAGAYEDAASSLLTSIRLDPSHSSYFAQLAKALFMAGDNAAAAATIARGLEFHPKDKTLRREQSGLSSARPSVTPAIAAFGEMRRGERARVRIMVHNAPSATGTLHGRITALPSWVDATPMTFITRHQQPVTLTADSAELWERSQPYEGLITIDTNGGALSVAARCEVRAPLRLFHESMAWYLPLVLLALLPLVAGEMATVRHHHHGIVPYFAAGTLAAGLLFAAIWQVCSIADAGPRERQWVGLGTLLAPLGVWLFWLHHQSHALWPAMVVTVMPTGLLLVLQGVAMLRSPEGWGRWPIWAGVIALVSLLTTSAFWQITRLPIRF